MPCGLWLPHLQAARREDVKGVARSSYFPRNATLRTSAAGQPPPPAGAGRHGLRGIRDRTSCARPQCHHASGMARRSQTRVWHPRGISHHPCPASRSVASIRPRRLPLCLHEPQSTGVAQPHVCVDRSVRAKASRTEERKHRGHPASHREGDRIADDAGFRGGARKPLRIVIAFNGESSAPRRDNPVVAKRRHDVTTMPQRLRQPLDHIGKPSIIVIENAGLILTALDGRAPRDPNRQGWRHGRTCCQRTPGWPHRARPRFQRAHKEG